VCGAETQTKEAGQNETNYSGGTVKKLDGRGVIKTRAMLAHAPYLRPSKKQLGAFHRQRRCPRSARTCSLEAARAGLMRHMDHGDSVAATAVVAAAAAPSTIAAPMTSMRAIAVWGVRRAPGGSESDGWRWSGEARSERFRVLGW